MLYRQMQRHERTHGQARNENIFVAERNLAPRPFDTAVPISPIGPKQIVFASAVTGKLHAVCAEAFAGEAAPDSLHLDRRAGQTVDQ